MHRPWTQAEEHLVEKLRLAGHCVPAIAAAVKRTETAVENKLKRLGVRQPSVLLRYLPLVGVEHTLANVAAQVGRSIRTIEDVKRDLRARGFAVYCLRRGGVFTGLDRRYCKHTG